MAKTPWEMAAVGKEFSHQTALFAWAAMARQFGADLANDRCSYNLAAYARSQADLARQAGKPVEPLTELKWLHAIKNQGHGDRIRGARSAAEGVREGVFDVFLPVAKEVDWSTKSYLFGLYIELKTPDRINHKDGGASQAQLDFQADMRSAGYAAEICHGWEAARDCLLTYLGKSAAS